MKILINERQYKLFLENVTSIPTYKNVNVVRNFFDKVKKRFPKTPEYVIKDVIESKIINNPNELKWTRRNLGGDPMLSLDNWTIKLLEGPWTLKILDVNPEDFNDSTVNAFIERRFGEINTYMVPDDEKRMETQRKLAKGDGKNQPIIVIYDKKTGKYQLIEGWHRTMSLLKLGDNGEDLKNWEKVKIRAYVNLNSDLTF